MEKIIDMHAHLGDILYPGGGSLIFKKGLKKRAIIDIVSISEFFDHRFADDAGPGYYGGYLHKLELKSSMARNAIGSEENFIRSMDEAGITQSVSLPVPPNVNFADIKKVADRNSRVIPFTGYDFSMGGNAEKILRNDVAQGARGLKLHPILQREKTTSTKTFEVVEAFAQFDFPILLHTGICYYYCAHEDKTTREVPEYGKCEDFIKLVKSFPKVKFIAGHACIWEWHWLKETMARLKNIYVDITFRGPRKVKELIDVMGPDRVLFASDWPWGNRKPAVRILEKACQFDKSIMKRVFYENAEELLKL